MSLREELEDFAGKKKRLPSSAKKIVTGEWDGEPIWHYETAEERLLREGIDPATLEIATVLLGEKNYKPNF